jgi:hypothetical protein
MNYPYPVYTTEVISIYKDDETKRVKTLFYVGFDNDEVKKCGERSLSYLETVLPTLWYHSFEVNEWSSECESKCIFQSE